jgi:hypothetical protein
MKACGLTECELWSPMIEPASPVFGRRATPEEAQQARADLRKWRLETPLDHFRGIRKSGVGGALRPVRLRQQRESGLDALRRHPAARQLL